MQNVATRKNYLIHTLNLRYVLDLFFFLLSFIHSYVLIIWLLGLIVVKIFTLKSEGAVEAFILIQLRSVINPGIAVDIGSVSVVKWICVFMLSFYLILINLNKISTKSKKAIILIIVFATYLALASLLTSSYPLTAVFKVISYAVPFIAIICGVNATKILWIDKIVFYFGILIVLSVLTIPFSFARLRNGTFFQGLTNHPNMFGILTALFLASLFYKQDKNFTFITAAVFVLCLVMLWLSRSRTGLLSAMILFLIYVLASNVSTVKKIAITISILLFLTILIVFDGELLYEYFKGFIYKGGDNIADSRVDQIETNLSRFLHSPILGTGFNVPYIEGVRTFEFSFDLITENGNLILALLGDTGILGTILFIVCYGYIFRTGKGICLFIAPILISLGEMTFFSTNNIGLLLYLFYAIYLSNGRVRNENSFYIKRI